MDNIDLLTEAIRSNPFDYLAYIAFADLTRESFPEHESLAYAYEWMGTNSRHPLEDADGTFYWLCDDLTSLVEGEEERTGLETDFHAVLPDSLFDCMAGPLLGHHHESPAISCHSFDHAVALLAQALEQCNPNATEPKYGDP